MAAIAVIGECMLELRQASDQRFELRYGGDAFNTAVYARRAGLQVRFLTATGDDHYSDWLVEQWQAEGLDCGAVRRLTESAPALYAIRNDERGERTFHYWRDASPFRRWLDGVDSAELDAQLAGSDLVYATGIGLALLPDAHKEFLLDALQRARGRGSRIALDPNYRPRLWDDPNQASRWFERAYGVCDVAMPSLDDEGLLATDPASATAESLVGRLSSDLGVAEVVVKNGAHGCVIACDGEVISYPLTQQVEPVDTTAAGDSFNAAYLAARLHGNSVADAVAAGQEMAAIVVSHPGAIVPTDHLQAGNPQ